MSSLAIRAEGLGKRFRLGTPENYKALRDSLVKLAKTPLRFFSKRSRSHDEDSFLWALRDVSFEIRHGEVLGIIGHNGAGKSTLLKILSRITEPTEGEAVVHGRVGSLLEVGTGFHPELTGRENVYLNGAILGMLKAEIDRKFEEIVAFAEVEKFLDTPVKRFSSGMQMRLAFAVAAHMEPEILLVDEVLAVGDLAFQRKCLRKMQDVSGTGRTVLFVSHNMGAIQRLCPRCLLLDHGRLVQDGPTEDIVRAYIAQGVDKSAVYVKPHDPDKLLHLRRVVTRNRFGKAQREFRFDEGIEVAIDFEVNRQTEGCYVWTGIRTVEQTWVLGTSEADADAATLESRAPGLYRTTFELPRGWLNAGMYELVVGITRHPSQTAHERAQAGIFQILDVETPSQVRFGQSRPGVIQPRIEWRTVELAEAQSASAP